jgi:hypothetical protein
VQPFPYAVRTKGDLHDAGSGDGFDITTKVSDLRGLFYDYGDKSAFGLIDLPDPAQPDLGAGTHVAGNRPVPGESIT